MRCVGLCLGLLLVLGATNVWAAEEVDGFKQGDFVIVKVDKAELRQGSDVVAHVSKGARLRVMAARKGWLLVPYKAGDEILDAYIRNSEVEKEIRAAGGGDTPAEKKPAESGAGYHEDDVVVVIGKEAKLMMGKDVLGPVAAGTQLTVKKLNDKWLGVFAPIEGKQTWGWIHSREVDYPKVGDKAPDKAPEKAPEK